MKEAFGFTKRLLHRDFSGYTGMAVKNSIYSFMTSSIAKMGSLLFTAILVGSTFLIKISSLFSIEIKPLLTPEIFGLYSLALSTILIFAGFTDLGIGNALIRYISKYNKNSRGYIRYLIKLKLLLALVVILILLFSSRFIATYYNKPIFLALLAGAMYIASTNLFGFISGFFQAENNFRILFWRELLFQTLRLIIVPIVIIYSLAHSTDFLLMIIILSLAICYFLAMLFLGLNTKKYYGDKLTKNKKKEVLKFVWPMTAMALSGTFFGYIDILMLGKFVESQFLAYYQSAFALLSSGIVIISFSSVLFPIFSRLKGTRLLNGLKKSIFVTLPVSTAGVLFTYFVAHFAIILIYNFDYLPSVKILQALSILILIDPLISIFSSFYISEGRSFFVAKVLVISTLVNITLNYFFITSLLSYGSYVAVFGAVGATIISRISYLGMFVFGNKKSHKN